MPNASVDRHRHGGALSEGGGLNFNGGSVDFKEGGVRGRTQC